MGIFVKKVRGRDITMYLTPFIVETTKLGSKREAKCRYTTAKGSKVITKIYLKNQVCSSFKNHVCTRADLDLKIDVWREF